MRMLQYLVELYRDTMEFGDSTIRENTERIIKQYDEILAEWWCERSLVVEQETTASIWEIATTLEKVFPNGRTTEGRAMGIDKILAELYTDREQEVRKTSPMTEDRKAEFQMVVDHNVHWKYNTPSCCPRAKKALDEFLDYTTARIKPVKLEPRVSSLQR